MDQEQTDIDFVVFYSWQSDLPDSTNRRAIRSAIRAASSKAEEKSDVRVVMDEATRDLSGSPNIPASIIAKIEACDLFICDLTTINSGGDESFRRTPNPNVLFELGYALSQVGWSRVVMLFNQEFGNFPSDLPFDIDRHRASPYKINSENPKDKANIKKLESLISDALSSVISNNPPKPSDLKAKSPQEIKKERDVKNISWAIASLHIPSLTDFIDGLPRYLPERIFHFWESFKGVVRSPLFHVYDKRVEELLVSLCEAWETCLSFPGRYHSAPGGNVHIFANPGDAALDNEQERDWDEINNARSLMAAKFHELLDVIRAEYIEIDIDLLSKNAWKEYIEFQHEMLDELEDDA